MSKCDYCGTACEQICQFRQSLREYDQLKGTVGVYPPIPIVAAANTWIATPNGKVLGLCDRHYQPFAAKAVTAA